MIQFAKATRILIQALFLLATTLSSMSLLAQAEAAENEDPFPYIVSSIDVPGYAKKMLIPKNAPGQLYVLVQDDGPPKPANRTGLYLFDITNPRNPKQIAYVPVTSPIGMDINGAGTKIVIYSRYVQKHDPNGWYGIKTIDITRAPKLKESGKLEHGIFKAALSPENELLLVFDRNFSSDHERYLFKVYSLSTGSTPELLSTVKKGNWSGGYGIFPVSGGKQVMIQHRSNGVVVYDISNPRAPREMREINLEGIGYPKAIGSKGTAFLSVGRYLALAKLQPEVKATGQLLTELSDFEVLYIDKDENKVFLSTIYKTLRAIDVTRKESPKIIKRYDMPNYVGSMVPDSRGELLFVGLLNAVVAVDPEKLVVNGGRLLAAHEEAVRQYKNATDARDKYSALRNATRVLEIAGVQSALDNPMPGIPDRKLAEILNDYGFFLAQRLRDEEAIHYYRRVIQLDPDRSVVYLNLGDSLRSQFRTAATYTEKSDMAREVKKMYLLYKQKSRRTTKEIENFLSLNFVDKQISNFCEYVATYANNGRLKELYGSGRSVTRADGKSKMKIHISYQGTAHMPWVQALDSETNTEIFSNEELGDPEDAERNRWAQNVSVIPFLDGHHLLYANDGGYLIESAPIGMARRSGKSCRYSVSVVESFNQSDLSKDVCELVSANRSESIDETTGHALAPYQSGSYDSVSEKAMVVDFDNDGNKEVLVELFYASGAGRGCDRAYFNLLNNTRTGIEEGNKRQLLMKMQGNQCGNMSKWFHHQGTTYYETRHSGGQPSDARQEYHTVSYLKDGQIHKSCEAEFRKHVEYSEQ